MPIIVKPMNKDFKVEFKNDEESVVLTFHQLDYRTKSEITSQITGMKNGQLYVDSVLQIYLNIKYSLKKAEGLFYPAKEGEEPKPYQLRFEDDSKRVLEDSCVDELLSTSLSDDLQYVSNSLKGATMPTEIINPVTGEPLEGVSILPSGMSEELQKK